MHAGEPDEARDEPVAGDVMFGKRPSELTSEDIDRLISEQVQEGSQVELKRTLQSNDGDDPWVSGQNEVGTRARNKLVEEVIAFANAYGGWLFLGVDETSTKPNRASAGRSDT
jgi:predicted HTH transcriptional regulator